MARQPKAQRMLTHDQVWTALDRLAERAGLSASGLAKRAGLDPTTFNKSKRITADGRERWPSTESIAKALAATNSLDRHFRAVDRRRRAQRAIGAAARLRAGRQRRPFDDCGFPAGKGWDEVALPSADDEHAYALEISGDPMKPAYRDGDIIMVSPGTADPARRPRGGEDRGRRGDGQGIETPHRADARIGSRSIRRMPTARWTPTTSRGSRGSCGRASRLATRAGCPAGSVAGTCFGSCCAAPPRERRQRQRGPTTRTSRTSSGRFCMRPD